MYLLDICESLGPVLKIVNLIITVIWIGIPIILIILGSIDLGKAVIASKEDEVKKAKQAFIRRLLYAIAVFAVVWLVTFVFDTISSVTDGEITTGDSWKSCWREIRKG